MQMNTEHKIHYIDSRRLDQVADETIHLVVTSPPYPMIAMWDRMFVKMNPSIGKSLSSGDGMMAFHLMHKELSKTWKELYRVLVPGGIACINIGDATRNIQKNFRLYPNHAQILSDCVEIGFETLPEIVWRKPTNAPNKFLGSGTLPYAAYVTLEHEFILILRKPGRRSFKSQERKSIRWQSSFFWDERNTWFSDVWDLNGIKQKLNAKTIRKRSGAFPFEIPYRRINMYSSKLDIVFDPFLGTGTTMLAAIACCRNSIGFELEKGFRRLHTNEIPSKKLVNVLNTVIEKRLRSQADSLERYQLQHGSTPKYRCSNGFMVITRQEVQMSFERISRITKSGPGTRFNVDYEAFEPDQELAARLGSTVD
jgi:DNA modification methylase